MYTCLFRERPLRSWTDDIKQWTEIPAADCVQRVQETGVHGDPWCLSRRPPIHR